MWQSIIIAAVGGLLVLGAQLLEIKNLLNKRSTDPFCGFAEPVKDINIKLYEDKVKTLFDLSSPYEIKNGIRFLRGTDKFVSELVKVICIDKDNNKLEFVSISECSRVLKIDRQTIKKYLLSGLSNGKYKFFFSS